MRRIALLVLAMTGCASTPAALDEVSRRTGAVGVREVTEAVPASGRLTLMQRESFQMPLAEGTLVLPEYPQSLLAQRLPPQVVCLRVGVGAEGRVIGAWPGVEAGGCPAPGGVDARFLDAAATAAVQWRFDPAFRCVFPDAEAKARGEGLGCMGGREEPVPVSLAYRFVFEQQDGRGTVRLGD